MSMMRSKYPYCIADEVKFGKYRGLTVEKIFSGADTCPLFWIDNIICEYFLSPDIFKPQILNSRNDLEEKFCFYESHGTNFLCVFNDFIAKRPSFSFEINNGTSIYHALNKVLTDKLYNSDTRHLFSQVVEISSSYGDDSTFIILSGKPSYFEWLITNTDMFFMEPQEFELLEKCIVNHWCGFALEDNHIVDSFVIKPVIEKTNFYFSATAHQKNTERYNKFLQS